MKLIFYVCNKREHIKVFESFIPSKDIRQILVTPSFIKPTNLKIPHLTFDYQDDFKQLIKKHKPDIYVQCDFSTNWHEKLVKYGIKIAFIGHGIWDTSPSNSRIVSGDKLQHFDAMFGGNQQFKDTLVKDYNVSASKIFLNSLPQFDTLYNRIQKFDTIRSKLISSSRCPTATKVITLFSHRMGSKQFAANQDDYYNSAIKLAALAKKNNWLLIIKLKQKETNENSSYKSYYDLKTDDNVMFINPGYESYDYFCSDAIVSAARSTVEIEACLANKPLILVRTEFNSVAGGNDTLKTIETGCAYLVDNLSNLEDTINTALFSSRVTQIKNQKDLISKLGITFDGKAQQRILKVLKKL